MTVQERLGRIEDWGLREGTTCRHCEERERRSNPVLFSGLLRAYLAMTVDWIFLAALCDDTYEARDDEVRSFLWAPLIPNLHLYRFLIEWLL